MSSEPAASKRQPANRPGHGFKVLGVDQSLTGTGLALACRDGRVHLKRVDTGKLRGHERLALILGEISVRLPGTDLVVLEDLAFGARGNSLLDLAGLQWLIRHRIWEMDVPYVLISPYQRAEYATGRAGASKDEVLAAVIRRFPDLPVSNNDEADAVVLMAMGLHHYGHPLVPMPAYATAVLSSVHSKKGKKGQPKIRWPAV